MRQRRQRRARRPWPPPSPARASPGPLRGDPTSSLHPFSSLFSAFPSDRAESSNLAPAAAATACRDERFGKESHYEWSKDFSHFGHLLPVPLGVLEVGCGNSRLGEELLQEGVAGGITCVDLSPVAGQRMRDRLAAQGTKGVDVVVADMLDLPLEPWSFDLVVEKGTMASSLAKMVLSAQGPGDLFLPFGPEYLENMSINLDHPKLSGETTVQSAVTEVAAMVGENVKFRRGFMLSTTGHGVVSSYMHTCPQPGLGRIAGLVTLEAEDSSALLDALKTVGSSIAMHIVAAKPLFLSKELVSAAALENERDILRTQAESSGKSQMAMDKMVEGRLRKYFEEVVLMEQKYILNDSTNIKTVLNDLSKDVGSKVTIGKFIRMQVGEGIEA